MFEGTGYLCGLQINPLSSDAGKPENPGKNHRELLRSGHKGISENISGNWDSNLRP